jgi:hypothetical protein
MAWFGRPPATDVVAQNVGTQALVRDLDRRVAQYLDDVDQARLVYPACKRTCSDIDGDVRSVWEHTRLEAARYVTMVPRHEFGFLAEPASQLKLLDAYLRQRPHDDIVIDFTGSTMSDLAIAIIAGFNWLNHCAGLVEVDRGKFRATLSIFARSRYSRSNGGRCQAPNTRCAQMLSTHQTPPLFINLIWIEYTRLAKEIASAATFGSSINRAIEQRRKILDIEFKGRPDELVVALDELRQTMKSFEEARDPGDFTG